MKAYLIYDVENKTYYEPMIKMKDWKQSEDEFSGGFWSQQAHELCYFVSKTEAKKVLDMLVWAEERKSSHLYDIEGKDKIHFQLLEVEVDPEMGYSFKRLSQDKEDYSKK